MQDKRIVLYDGEALLHNRRVLDVRRLRVLKAVVEAGSVTAAAQRLGYTPSAVSQHVAALEREAGTTLLERSGRGVRPTRAGLLLAEHAGAVLARLAEAENALVALRAGQSGRLGITAFPTAGATLVPAAVGRFRVRRPGVHLDVTVAETDEATDAVRSGRVDVGVTVEPSAPGSGRADDLVHVHLLADPFRVVLPRGHRLASRRRIDIGELAAEPWVATSSCPASCQQQAVDACAAAGFTPRFTVQADDYPATQGYVAVGLGVALVPVLGLGGVHDGVVVRRLRDPEPVRHVYAVTRRSTTRDGAVPVMLDALRDAAAELGALARR